MGVLFFDLFWDGGAFISDVAAQKCQARYQDIAFLFHHSRIMAVWDALLSAIFTILLLLTLYRAYTRPRSISSLTPAVSMVLNLAVVFLFLDPAKDALRAETTVQLIAGRAKLVFACHLAMVFFTKVAFLALLVGGGDAKEKEHKN